MVSEKINKNIFNNNDDKTLSVVTIIEKIKNDNSYKWLENVSDAIQSRLARMPRNGWEFVRKYYNEKFNTNISTVDFKKHIGNIKALKYINTKKEQSNKLNNNVESCSEIITTIREKSININPEINNTDSDKDIITIQNKNNIFINDEIRNEIPHKKRNVKHDFTSLANNQELNINFEDDCLIPSNLQNNYIDETKMKIMDVKNDYNRYKIIDKFNEGAYKINTGEIVLNNNFKSNKHKIKRVKINMSLPEDNQTNHAKDYSKEVKNIVIRDEVKKVFNNNIVEYVTKNNKRIFTKRLRLVE